MEAASERVEPSPLSPSPSPSRGGLAAWVACFAVAAGLYYFTCQRGVGWQDSGLFQWRVLTGDYRGDLGLALAHPIYIAAGRVVFWLTGENMPMGLNFFSGRGMAVALANLMCVVTLLTGRRWIGLAVAGMLAVTHTAWWLATIAEVYTWVIAGLTAELWLLIHLVRRPRWSLLAGLALVSGLGLALHNFALLPLPVYFATALWLVAQRKLPGWSIAAAAGAYLLGASPYLAMVVRYAVEIGSVGKAVGSALWGGVYESNVLNTGHVSTYFKENAVFIAMNFVGVLLPLAVIGWARWKRRLGGPLAAILGAIALVEIVFFVRYNVLDQFTFILPTMIVISVAAGVGLDVLCGLSARWRAAALTACVISIVAAPALYAAAPELAARVRPQKQRHAYRDEARYWMVPWKHNENSAQRFARAALVQAGPNGVIIPDSTSGAPLAAFQRLRGFCPEVEVQWEAPGPLPEYSKAPAQFRQALGGRRLFLTSLSDPDTTALQREADVYRRPGESMYRVEWKPTSSASPPAP
ncbi:MAG: hypothetical protein NT031_19015 [Planctomycetota bacterium]|nr:hypothetical protein [Planctomycetota bacterium]